MSAPLICVVGAANIDLISYVPRLPAMGETLHGTQFHMGYGGKGANQAVMAARLGSRVAMVAKVGRDDFGEGTLHNFRECGVDVTHVSVTERAATGVAPIAVDIEGRNSIIIVTGANDLLSVDDLDRARDVICASRVLVCQLEIPLEVSLHAMEAARAGGVTTILNPAPAPDGLPERAYALADVLCPNESEAERLAGTQVSSPAGAERTAQLLLERGAGAIVLTLGERGCLVADRDRVTVLPAPPVRAVDTTGAGDAFVGSLGHFLAAGRSLIDAASRANQVAAISVQRRGTQTSFPGLADLPSGLLE